MRLTVGAVVEDLSHVYTSPGTLRFDFGGRTHRLTAFNGKSGAGFSVLFTDATSGVTTYPANRSLAVVIERVGLISGPVFLSAPVLK